VSGFAALFILRRDSQTALPKIALSVGLCLSVNGRTVGFRVADNVSVACAVAKLKVGSLMKVPKVERTYLLEPLHKAAIAQLPRVRASL
jgi:hypothetical protein